jgi:TolB-like protein
MPAGGYSQLEFAGYVLDPVERTLRPPGDGAQPAPLQPKLLETLLVLVEARGALVTKEALIERVWPDVEVLDGSLTRNIYLLRQILGENAIQTVSKSGYRFTLGPVVALQDKRESLSIQSVAVMPFVLVGPSEDEYLADGLTEEIIDRLTRLPAYRVVARSTSFQFKGRMPVDPRKVGLSLGVEAILEGSLRRAGKRVRVTVQLTATATGFHVWSESYDREMPDLLDLQQEIASLVVRRMGGAADPSPQFSFQPCGAAYDWYARGRFLASADSNLELAKAVECYRQAVAMEPLYDAAHIAIADAYIRYVTYGDLYPHEGSAIVRQHLAAALHANPNNAQAHSLQAVAKCIFDWDYPAAASAFERVIEAAPWFGFARYLYAFFLLIPLGRFRAAAEQLASASVLDPLSTHIQAARIGLHLFEGNLEQAVMTGAAVAQHAPGSYLIAIQNSWALMTAGRLDDATAEIDRAKVLGGPTGGLVRASEGLLAGMRGDFARAFEIFRDDPFNQARLYAWLGKKDDVIRCLRMAVEARSMGVPFLSRLPEFAPFYGDPEFERLRRAAGLAGD